MYGERIKFLRLEKGWSQEKLATILNITQKTVIKYETETLDLSTDMLIRLCYIFETKADYILGLEDETGTKIQNINQTFNFKF